MLLAASAELKTFIPIIGEWPGVVTVWRAMWEVAPTDDELERLRREVAALRECVKAADAMRKTTRYRGCTCPECAPIRSYDAARAALGDSHD